MYHIYIYMYVYIYIYIYIYINECLYFSSFLLLSSIQLYQMMRQVNDRRSSCDLSTYGLVYRIELSVMSLHENYTFSEPCVVLYI
jgi:hypothetical protein